MKVYNKEGQTMSASEEQLDTLKDTGWTTTKPEGFVEETEAEKTINPVNFKVIEEGLKAKADELAKKEVLIANEDSDLADREATLMDKTSEITDRERKVTEKEAELVDRESALNDRESALNDRESALDNESDTTTESEPKKIIKPKK